MSPPKLVLAVIDGCNPEMLERAVETGRAPAIRAVVERGTLVREGAIAPFPSVTPVCAAAITTGTRQDEHLIAGMNWYWRERGRYVEYGSSFAASRRFGILQQLTDTIFNMNGEHLSADVQTVFERLDDAGVRTAGTTYLIHRGRHRHEISRALTLSRMASAVWRRHVMGPRELHYADVFASRETGCRSQMGLPGMRDQHGGCVAAYLVEHDLFDFLLLSLPDNDTYSHKHGPAAQLASIAEADRQLVRMMDAGGGADAFLDRHAVIVMADHAHSLVEHRIDLEEVVGDLRVLPPKGRDAAAEVALCPNARAAMVYVLAESDREQLSSAIGRTAAKARGVDLAAWRDGGIATLASSTGELRFAPGGPTRDGHGRGWQVDGDPQVLEGELRDGVLVADRYPDALARVWSALSCPTSGDVLLSASPGFEFADWGGADHRGGGSHGSLHRCDSMGALAYCGIAPDRVRHAWSATDIAPAIQDHFGVA